MSEEYLIPFLISGSLILTLFVFYITIFVVAQKSKQRRYEMEKTELKHHYETSLLRSKLEVQEQALNQLSREIHDNINQTLGTIKYNLITLAKTPGIDTTSVELIADSKGQLNKAIGDLRNVSHVLNTEHLHHIGLEESIKKELHYREAFNDFKCTLFVKGEKLALSNEKELLIFRIVQEALTNITKHAKAKSVNIKIDYQPDNFELIITDDGIGFKRSNENLNGIGLINMYQRAKLMNGNIVISSNEPGGTIITLSVKTPYDKQTLTNS